MAENIEDIYEQIKDLGNDTRSDESYVAVEESSDFIKGLGRVLAGSTLASILILILVAMVFNSLMLLILSSTIFVLLALAFNAWLILGRWDARLLHIELLNQRFSKVIERIEQRLPSVE